MTGHESMFNFHRINDALTTSGLPSEEQLRAAASAGVEVVINLALHDDPPYSLPGEEQLVRDLGMEYVHIPVLFDAPKINDYVAFASAMKQHAEKKVHVHCAANMRVTAFLGLYRLLEQKLPDEEAFAPMRSIWEPAGVWAAFIEETKRAIADAT